jgi:amiloride-sensitive sodium channel
MSEKRKTFLFFCRVLWVIVVVLGVVGSSFMVNSFWTRYMGTQTRTSVETNHYPTWRLPFPAVTLCNVNRMLRSKAEALVSKL